ncbi:helix-hairpin-helix domain-containing protein [Vagococcus acidifermentans]|uniref:Helix-hairpin-helix DNA-binding motif class 1 domain-containing protein n=1 Tax=Vagococcus acidifermentans TaxID=564710 RepID=A0A430B082_9ENTE|nr:helix-hairpin-helix domain-containing protein [Vagococcus acidifermentans]RSU13750.1 hypothetical protein CBF27_02285 [Vagococcus acidifermentans]
MHTIFQRYQKWFQVGLVITTVVLLVCVVLLARRLAVREKDGTSQEFETLFSSSEQPAEATASSQPQGYADIKGAVKQPGMYAISENMRLIDMVERAGGFLENADTSQVNYSQLVSDQMVIYVPEKGEQLTSATLQAAMQGTTPTSQAENQGKVNINTADSAALQQLNGIGEKKAEKIIQYREQHGSFKNIEELMDVSGIGEKTFESLKDLITI